jgi:hypothetical protein
MQMGIEATEDEILEYAIANGLAAIIGGGTDQEHAIKILEHYNLTVNKEISLATTPGLDTIAGLIESGKAIYMGVSSSALWNGGPPIGLAYDHAIVVTGVARNTETGEIEGFYICDSGRHLESDSARFVSTSIMTQAYLNIRGDIITLDLPKLHNDPINGTGNDLANIITGNDSDNVLDGKAGADTLIGNGGNDTYKFDDKSNYNLDVVYRIRCRVNRAAYGNMDVLDFSGATNAFDFDFRLANGGVLASGSDISGIERVIGGSGKDTITGNDQANILDGGTGADNLAGGLGDDIYYVDYLNDLITEISNQQFSDAGKDSVYFQHYIYTS